VVDWYAEETMIARDEIQTARDLLPQVNLPEDVARIGLELVHSLGIASLRAEISLFEASRALAAADGRVDVTEDDLRQVAPMALRLRRSKFISDYLENQAAEEQEISENLGKHSAKDEK
jgi:Mg-chelatase subunit ChlI